MTNAISANGLALIQQHEGFRAEPAQLPDGNWVVGYSHVRVGEPGAPVSESEAADLLTIDLAPVERLINARVAQTLTQSQFDALVSFAFSIGEEAFASSQVLRRVAKGDFVAAACAMDAWRKSEVSGELEIVDSLVRRRAAEKAMFLRDLPQEPAPSVFVRPKLDHAASILGAPLNYAATPAVGSVPVVTPKAATVDVITEVLKSEPATEVLLLTREVPADVVEDDGEIVTAHAKPVARTLDDVREATRRAYAEESQKPLKRSFKLFGRQDANKIEVVTPALKVDRRIRRMRHRSERFSFRFNPRGAWESVGLLALLGFGLALVGIGGSVLLESPQDFVTVGGAAGLIAPGLAAVLMAVAGFMRGPAPAHAPAPANG